jgi:uncharacterized repeat protein (TIGR03803 family)
MRFSSIFFVPFLATAVVGCSQMQGHAGSTVVPAISQSAQRKPAASSYRVVYAFRGYGDSDGGNPVSSLVEVAGLLYGTTNAGGSIKKNSEGSLFEVSLDGKERVVYSFGGTDGAKPFSNLAAVGDNLYGTTSGGGANNSGTVFAISTSGAYRLLHAFAGGSDGAAPVGDVMVRDGALYGTTNSGGRNNGTVYSAELGSGTERVLYAFAGGNDGSMPRGGVIHFDGGLYGTTLQGGGRTGSGTVFEIKPFVGAVAERVVYGSPGAPEATNPAAGLVELDGSFYGTSQGGGKTGFGTVFEVGASGGERAIYSFKSGTDGSIPVAALVVSNGKLYGTTSQGGSDNAGTVFEITKSGEERVLYSFRGGKDGKLPGGALLASGGKLYGMTRYGGGSNKCALGCGTVYEVTP